jgi:hypothetical protein
LLMAVNLVVQRRRAAVDARVPAVPAAPVNG